MGQTEDLLDLGGDHQHGRSLLGEVVDKAVDRRAGAESTPARGFIEDQNRRVTEQQAGKQDLLLVAARQAVGRAPGCGGSTLSDSSS